MDINKATDRYEAWLRATLPMVVEADLEFKHQQMASAVFPFLRATFYRWAQRWPELCPHLASAPAVLGVGDLHVENYGTWRDAEGRLVWGINDFDEATNLPYAADLVRLATSASIAGAEQHLSLPLREAATAVLSGYQAGLSCRGEPFVLAERHSRLRRMATGELRDPVRFWTKMNALPKAQLAVYPPDAVDTLMGALPDRETDASVRSRRAGLGSLGRPRLVALSRWQGGSVAREVKAVAPSAWDWARGGTDTTTGTTGHGTDTTAGRAETTAGGTDTTGHETDAAVHSAEIVERAVRCADPYTGIRDRWLIRRLAPDCARIELADLPAERDETTLAHSMGFELANIHLGTPGAVPDVLDDLAERGQRHPDWLVKAAERMAADTEADWNAWRSLSH